MTFHDPASIESGCVYARGRNHKRQRVEMLSNIVFWVTLIELQIVCFGIPTTEYYTYAPTVLTNITTDVFPIIHEVTEELNDTVTSLDSTNSSSNPSVTFIDVPQHTETAFGTSVLLTCRTAEPVLDCQWSWRPLPPVNLPLPDINPSLNSNETTHEVVAVSPAATTQSVPVQIFPAFGNNSNDCSVRFKHTKYEQIGYWTCAVRSTINDTFISTEPAMLSIASDKPDVSTIIFDESEDVEASPGTSTQLICRTLTPVNECQWYWRLFNQSEQYDLAVERFNAFGIDKTDCSIKFDNVLLEQEGLWTCGVRINVNATFVKVKPISFFVSEVKFVQLSQGIQAAAGESALLRCLVDKPVVQCEWSRKPLNSNKEPEVIKMFVPNNDNKHDCAVRFKNVLHEEEGIWTCGVRLTMSGRLHEAEPAKLTLLPSAKFNFTELPENTSMAIGSHTILKCAASSRVEKCTWLWRPLIDDVEIAVMHEYVGQGNLGKNCSLEFPRVRIEDQGYWSCRVSLPSSNTILTSPLIRLIVYNEGKVEFSELSRYIQKSLGSSVFLKCTTSSAVEKCQWSFTPALSNTTVVVKQLSPVDNESKDCSVRLSHALAEQQGLWTCGVKPFGKNTYINAQPAKLELIEPGIIGT
ncbi:hypothetical protein PV327_008268 [Microctonus hyperodae]|uniref:Ig-like domain-containing protein n=1 Tax=Microctonus hyperodae TaxID=165561 RepID=A0AA39F2S2_MICHY|nr:hypothetical protein PV327_008268 [Microctonus hyperodae]